MKWLICFILAFGPLQGMNKAPPPVSTESTHLGVRTLHYQDTKRNRPILVEFWYPTSQAGPYEQSDDGWIHPNEIRNVPLASSAKHPLIVMSHGHGGDRRDRTWIIESLVQKGFVVASVEHYGNSWKSYDPLVSLRFWERARDISFVVTQILKDPALKKQVDPNRIGFVGYSLGGMTGLALAGAKAENVKEIITLQQKRFNEIDPSIIEKIDFTEAHSDFKDPRIKAFVLLSPALFVYPPHTLRDIHVPTALVATEDDEVLPHNDHALQVITHLHPHRIKLYSKLPHSIFLNRSSEDDSNSTQSDVHQEVATFAAEFLEEELK